MRLAEQDVQGDNLLAAVERQLRVFGADEVASYVEWDGRHRHPAVIWIATTVGIYKGRKVETDDGDASLESDMTPWSEVRGAGLAIAGFVGAAGPMTLTVSISMPEFHGTGQLIGDETSALRDFANESMRRQRGRRKGTSDAADVEADSS